MARSKNKKRKKNDKRSIGQRYDNNRNEYISLYDNYTTVKEIRNGLTNYKFIDKVINSIDNHFRNRRLLYEKRKFSIPVSPRLRVSRFEIPENQNFAMYKRKVCSDRASRRRSIFANKATGKGSKSKVRLFTEKSKVRC